MRSSLAWLDHDAEARDLMERVLALFEERNTVDELGLGGIRDAFSDRLFPGTSTIQTRLRYFLILPWAYQQLERGGVGTENPSDAARELEYGLTEALLESDDLEGVFGREAGRSLRRLAGDVYWAGLEVWGIRRFLGSRSRYLAALDAIARGRERWERRSGVEEEPELPSTLITWDPSLPDPPADFPEKASLRLRPEEAEYLQDRVQSSSPGSLLAFLFLEAAEGAGAYPWEHPVTSRLPARHQIELHHSRVFSVVAEGAYVLYNLMLAERSDREDRIREYRRMLRSWETELDRDELGSWERDVTWELSEDQGHTITVGARRFVESWTDLVLEHRDVGGLESGRELVRRREERLKGARSRFRNARALDQWGGASGVGRYDYRWPIVRGYLDDLQSGLAGS